ncbi:MAG: hypothetical protein LJE93_03075 [Acidobacteria bacterium]|nr:hypothetical protein [Acidobacteriota bacterium]
MESPALGVQETQSTASIPLRVRSRDLPAKVVQVFVESNMLPYLSRGNHAEVEHL